MSTSPPKLILGWPRGGLGYLANVLRAGNQDVGASFDATTDYSNLAVRRAKTHSYEISSALPPFLSHPDLKDSQVFFVVRDPMRVLNSLYFHGYFHGERRNSTLRLACKHIFKFQQDYWAKPVQASVHFLYTWYSYILSKRPDAKIIHVEDGPVALLKQLTGTSPASVPYCDPEFNASGCRQVLMPSQLPEKSWRHMRAMLFRLGYLENMWNPRGGHAHYLSPDWHC